MCGIIGQRKAIAMKYIVKDDESLLKKLISDNNNAKYPWTITPYWQNYNKRIIKTLKRDGLSDFQSNFELLKGFISNAYGCIPDILPPNNFIKSIIFKAVHKLPFISNIFGFYRELISDQAINIEKIQELINVDILNTINGEFTYFKPPKGICAGNPIHTFNWNEYEISNSFVEYLSRVADFYKKVNPQEVKTLLEIGPGLCWSTLAHISLNPYLERVVNVDIPSTLYVSTQFLKSIPSIEVVGYKKLLEIGIPKINHNKVQCLQIPTWELQNIDLEFDWAHNAFSFMEMEKEVVNSYRDLISQKVKKGVWLLSTVKGHKPNAGGQKSVINIEFLEKCFSSSFTKQRIDIINLSKKFGIKNQDSLFFTK